MKSISLIGVAAILVGLAGCTPEGRDAYHNADQNQAGAAEKMVNAAKVDAKATERDLKKDAAASQERAAEEAMLMKVRSALAEAADLDTSKLTVDHTGRELTMTGSVPTGAQKRQAEAIAKGLAGKDYQVVDQLTVAGK